MFNRRVLISFKWNVILQAIKKNSFGTVYGFEIENTKYTDKVPVLDVIKNNILRGLPGSMVDSYNLDSFRQNLDKYKDLSKQQIQDNLKYFLQHVAPIAEQNKVYMAIHPDDPPIDLFGIPRIVSCSEDFKFVCDCYVSPYNGIHYVSDHWDQFLII